MNIGWLLRNESKDKFLFRFGDDTIGNGLSLCPNLHHAFDRGLIAIDDEYRVLVQPFLKR